MTTSPNPNPGEIWLAYVYFADHPNVGKVRPVLILSVDDKIAMTVVAKVTSQNVKERGLAVHEIVDWAACGLRKPSYIRLDQRLYVPFSLLLRDSPLGLLPANEFNELIEQMGDHSS